MSAKLPKVIRCNVRQNGIPLAGVLIKATLRTALKNAYSFVFGPTSSKGIAELQEVRIRAEATQELNLAIMDFEPLDEVFMGVVILKVMTQDDLERALRAYELYKDVSAFPDGYAEMLRTARPAIEGESLLQKHDVQIEPSEIQAVVT